ncbi:MAG: CHAT domain-containing protein [Piscinibacter sp.]|nr:CHAT domain-containing protein [Piscinibacter sp.]
MTIPIELRGREAEARLPDLFGGASRSADAVENQFLPSAYLKPRRTFDVGPAARSATEGDGPIEHVAQDDEVLVLELEDGETLITSAQGLREMLLRSHPELVGADDRLLLEKLRAEGVASRSALGEAVGGLVRRVFGLDVGVTKDEILKEAVDAVGGEAIVRGVSWAGTKALMWAIERRLKDGRSPAGDLFGWNGAQLDDKPHVTWDPKLLETPAEHPMLVFLHGTGSSSTGSFGELRSGDAGLWTSLQRQFPGGIYALEHPTLSASPIDNAIALLEALPTGAHLSLVSHSRGGLVGDLLCLGDFAGLIENFRHDLPGVGLDDAQRSAAVKRELDDAHAGHRDQLRRLAELLARRRPVVQRYVRVAAPAAGTRLASGNFDLFLSGVLSLIGKVPFFFGSPYYAAFKRVVLEIAKNRTDPHLVPGIEAMLPDSPLARLLRDAPVRDGMKMSVIAGDIEGGGLLKRLGVLLTDHLLFDNVDNDLVVDTPAMLAGIATRAAARVKFDRGAEVSHFRYFVNGDTRAALRDWLVDDRPEQVESFIALPAPAEYEAALQAAAAAKRDVASADRPVVVLLPGVMGSHLALRREKAGGAADIDRVWFDPLDIATGGLKKIAWSGERNEVFAEELFGMFYGKLAEHLSKSHRVERFAYDWRQPLDVLAERLGQLLDRLLAETEQPVRLLAHSMGGLVVRACIHRRRAVMDTLMARKGARLVMLGTPNQGAYSMVENLIGKGDTLRTLVRLDLADDMQQVLDIVAGFRGALQLLPKPGFKDIFQGQSDGGQEGWNFQDAATWAATFPPLVKDFWFGDGKVGRPTQQALDSASWLWTQDGTRRPALPEDYAKNAVYVYGIARNTPCGLREERGRLKMVGTTRGDGTVTWESGRIDNVGAYYYMPAAHGDLPSTAEYFEALVELLGTGSTAQLMSSPPPVRAIEQPQPTSYDAGPPVLEDADAVQRRLLGGSLRNRVPPRPKRRLEVSVHAMDLRFLSQPILVGHYEHDPIAGPQALVDRELLNRDLSERHALGLYPGPLGGASAVLRIPSELERLRGSLTGAVITGLGSYDKPLTLESLTEAVRAGALRYLLQVIDLFGKGERELPLAALLLGYNSSANLTVGASVEALVRGVMDANARFQETTGLKISIGRLQIVELYLDTAITAVYALRYLNARLAAEAQRLGTQLICRPDLVQGEGVRQRLLDSHGGAYWPRLLVTDADRDDATCPPECYAPRCPPECREDPCECRDAENPDGTPPVPRGPASRALVAERLRFLYVGQRARAESVVQQRQPGLIEQIVRRQIHSAVWQEDFGRMLFQLMVPHDFKDAARQLDRVVLVVDSYTANLPWELLLADDPMRQDSDKRPLALRTAVVRQLASTQFRRQVRQAIGRSALVIGNPSLDKFLQFFPGPRQRPNQQPPELTGAEAEAGAVAGVLRQTGYEVTEVIGADRSANDVLAALYRRPWRVLHISAHGVFDLRHVDGRLRSGVLLSDGVLLTAAEVDAMEVVPELVFLNCCHLGKVDSVHVRDGNKLAASTARELIEIGVRCVVVAGWAVTDTHARLFGETFYQHLLLHGRAFGDAVFEARKVVWEQDGSDITWGAFQAYGDPGWLAEPRAERDGGAGGDPHFVSPEELLDRLARLRADLRRRGDRQTESERRAQVKALEDLLRKRCPPAWLTRPELQSALGATWRDLGEFEAARTALQAALMAIDRTGGVPVRDIEQLANVEARLGERQGDVARVEAALQRLDRLDELVGASNPERGALRGSALKRLASLHARTLLPPDPASGSARSAALDGLRRALADCARAYRAAEGRPDRDFDPYPALNRLALEALLGSADPDAAALAKHCGRVAAQNFARLPDPWAAAMQPEALLVERLLDGSFGAAGEPGAGAFEAVAQAYAETLAGISFKPVELQSVFGHLELLSRLADALSTGGGAGAAALRRSADRLLQLLRRLQPGRRLRDDRPAAAVEAEAPPAPRAAAKAPRKAARKTRRGT